MNTKYFDEKFKDVEKQFKESSSFNLLQCFRKGLVEKSGLPSNVLQELSQVKYDYLHIDNDSDPRWEFIELVLYQDKSKLSYDRARGSVVRLRISDNVFNKLFIIKFAHDLYVPIFNEWYNRVYKPGTILIYPNISVLEYEED